MEASKNLVRFRKYSFCSINKS